MMNYKPYRPFTNIKETGMTIKDIANEELTYEKKHELNLGLSAGFLNNRINVEFDWFRRESVGMYSKLALGATYRSEKVEYNNRSTGGSETPRDNRSNSEFHFNWQATVFGIEAGSPMVRGFLETGFGEQGIACVGVRFKF